jgi:hypothetical protein
MDSDDVNSISDTTEATQVAKLVRRCYYDMINKPDLDEHFRLFELEATSSATPLLMTLPTDILTVEWIKYNKATTADDSPAFETIQFVELNEFLNRMYDIDDDDTNAVAFTYTISGDSINFLGYDDRMPTMYTCYDDYTIVFDSYDVAEDTNLQKTKTVCYGKELPTFTMSDGFTPDLDAPQFSILTNKVKSLAFAELKQVSHPLADREEKRHLVVGQRTKRAIAKKNELDRLPNYGRK